jgi:hypothetical protein
VGAGALSRCWRRRAGVGGGGTRQSTRGGRWKGGVGGDKHVMELGGGLIVIIKLSMFNHVSNNIY